MSKNRRDQLLNMAFGESEAEGMVYENLSEAERAELETLRKMRQGLQSMHDVPECQLSSERLRSAILNSSVKRKPVYALNFATGAIAFIAVALVAFNAGLFDKGDLDLANKTNTDVNPNSVIVDPIDVTAPERNLIGNDAGAESNVTGGSETVIPPAPEVSEENTASNSETSYVGDYVFNNNRSADYVPFTPVNYFPTDEVEFTATYQPSNEEEGTSSLVVVNNLIEDAHGAYEATEVETFGDVVFGG